ncbi:MAG: hypothetical protein Q9218_005207 [Villophora microphyllina]
MSGREIFKKRQQLRAFHHSSRYPVEVENPFTNFKTTEVEITSELANSQCNSHAESNSMIIYPMARSKPGPPSARGYDQYSVTVSSKPMSPTLSNSSPTVPPTPGTAAAVHYRHRAAMEANTAAWGYTKVALLFFVSLLITWVKRRSWPLIVDQGPTADVLVAGAFFDEQVVLPLMGWWNAVIYVTTSWGACKDLFFSVFFSARAAHLIHPSLASWQRGRSRSEDVAIKKHRAQSSPSDSMRGLASKDEGSAV